MLDSNAKYRSALRRLALGIFIVFSVLSCETPAEEQQVNVGNNRVNIEQGDTEADIIRKAANVAPSENQLRWQQLELTAFIHFGVNTFTDKEWGDGKESPQIFNPTAFDARQWARVCKEAGFRQITLTAKHHDGFCLWPSEFTGYSVKNSPWKDGKGDVVKEVADACREFGLGFGVYLSPWDRNSPLYGTDEYNEFFINQLTELLTNYGRIDEVWFDGANGEGPNGKRQVYDFGAYYEHIRKLQPGAVISVMGPDVRWVGTESGYGRETEWSVIPLEDQWLEKIADESQQHVAFTPDSLMRRKDLGSRERLFDAKTLVWYPAETNTSIRRGWFYHSGQDDQVKSPEKLLDIYYSSVGRNGLFLLNFPPDKRGLIHENDIRNLQEWRRVLDETFALNLARDANISSGGHNEHLMLDGDNATHWTTSGKDTSAVIEISLNGSKTFDVLALQENIRIGQRIEQFKLDCWDGEKWVTATEGTTVGYKRLLRFDPVSTDRVRLVILSSRLNPTIAEFGLYRQPEKS